MVIGYLCSVNSVYIDCETSDPFTLYVTWNIFPLGDAISEENDRNDFLAVLETNTATLQGLTRSEVAPNAPFVT